MIFTALSAACALAPTRRRLIAARAVQGVGGALMNPLSLSILVAAFPRKQLPTAIGIWAGISGLGLAIGPVLGGLLVEHVDWSAVFWINVPIGADRRSSSPWAVAESRDPGALASTWSARRWSPAACSARRGALIETNDPRLDVGLHDRLLAGRGSVLMGAFVAWEARTAKPMLPLSFFRRAAFSASGDAWWRCVGLALFGVDLLHHAVPPERQGLLGPIEAGVRTLPLTMMIMIVGAARRAAARASRPRGMMTLGMLLATAALLGLTQIEVDSSYNAIWPVLRA